MLRKKKVYIVEGFVWEKDYQYPLQLERMVFKDYKKAIAEIRQIASNIRQTMDEMELDAEISWNYIYNTLEVKYSNGVIDNYVILEREII